MGQGSGEEERLECGAVGDCPGLWMRTGQGPYVAATTFEAVRGQEVPSIV